MTHYDNRSLKKSVWLLMLLSALAFQMACEKTATAPATPAPIDTPDPVGTVNDEAGFYVKLYKADNVKARLHKDISAAGTDPCRVKSDDLVKDISCVVDIPEEDLFVEGLQFQYNVPSDMCVYVHQQSYYYENFMVGGVGGTGARAVASNINVYIKDDLVGFDHNGGNTLPDPAAAAPAGITGIDANGVPQCAFDYTDPDNSAPNCCTGTSKITTYKRKSDDSGWDVTRVDKKWGGDAAKCIDGAALDTQPLNKNGFPEDVVTFVENTGLNKTLEPKKPIEHFGYRYNLNLANFHEVLPAAPHGLDGSFSHQPYEWRCMDRAGDVKARIRLYVREWNEFTEWDAMGNPDTGQAAEPGTFGDDNKINDYYDWKDIFSQFAGFAGWAP